MHDPLCDNAEPAPAAGADERSGDYDSPWKEAIAAYFQPFMALFFPAVHGMGQERTAANRERFMAAGEALGGIKDIKLLGREYAYLSRFRPPRSGSRATRRPVIRWPRCPSI